MIRGLFTLWVRATKLNRSFEENIIPRLHNCRRTRKDAQANDLMDQLEKRSLHRPANLTD